MSIASTPALPVVYPPELPGPTSAPLTPTERRLRSEIPGPMQLRGVQRDFHGVQRLQFVFTADQARKFREWWEIDLYRGGMWFSADWPLPWARKGNVYRFRSAPSWEFIPGGPRGRGVRRLSIEVEVRGRGVPPLDYSLLIVTSQPYPLLLNDAVDISSTGLGGSLPEVVFPTDQVDMDVAFIGGELRTPLHTLSIAVDDLDLDVAMLGGELRQPLVSLGAPVESLDLGAQMLSGSLRVALVQYVNYPAESIDLGTTFLGGSLQ